MDIKPTQPAKSNNIPVNNTSNNEQDPESILLGSNQPISSLGNNEKNKSGIDVNGITNFDDLLNMLNGFEFNPDDAIEPTEEINNEEVNNDIEPQQSNPLMENKLLRQTRSVSTQVWMNNIISYTNFLYAVATNQMAATPQAITQGLNALNYYMQGLHNMFNIPIGNSSQTLANLNQFFANIQANNHGANDTNGNNTSDFVDMFNKFRLGFPQAAA